MAWPASLTLVTVRIQFDTPPDGGAFGAVRFTSPQALVGPDDDSIVPPIDQLARIAADGSGSIRLPARNVSGWDPTDWAYTVTASVNGNQTIRGTLILNPDDTEVQLSDRLQITSGSVIVPGVMYATTAQLAAGLATKAALVHSHAISDVADLQVQLDGKLDVPPEPYITADDIAGLVSYETMTEAVDTRLPKIAPAITDTTFTFTRSAGGSQTINASTGRADLGAKNSAANLQVCGYLDITTAPTTGTWATGDVVHTRIGMFRCTAGGTPGTWAPMWREQALDKGYMAWNGDPGQSVQAGTIVPTSGLSFVFRLRALSALMSLIHVHCTTTSTGMTNAWCTLHDDNGLILNANAKSNANQNTAFQSGGMKAFTFIAPQVVTPGAFYRARVWFTTGGTLPTISRMCNSNTAIINPDVSGTAASTPYGWASADSGLTDLASAPDQIGNLTGIGTAWWMGAK